jgi:radical SAM protein with 4Fe4S-binding SPASM domain
MPLLLAQNILRHLAGLGVFTTAFGGGEPFLHPDLFEIASFARRVGIVPNITTRGHFINDQTAEACQVFGNIHLSCNSLSEAQSLTNAVRRLRNFRISPGINLLATKASLPDFPGIFNWCAREQISRVLILRYKTTAANSEMASHFSLSVEQELGLLPTIRKLARKHRLMPLIDCSLFPALAVHGPRHEDLIFYDVNGCQGGDAFISITVDGHFKPCSFWPESFGSVLHLTRQTWQTHDRLEHFRRRNRRSCGACALMEICRGGCRLESDTLCHRAGQPPVLGHAGAFPWRV